MSLKNVFWAVTFVFLAVWPPTASMAAEPPYSAPDSVLSEMNIENLLNVTVYGASKFEQSLSEAPSSVTIVTSDEIKKYGYRTLGEILQAQRSLLISSDRNYSYSGVRGFSRTGDYSSRVLILIDGHRTNENVFDSGFYGYEFPLDVDLIERVEIIRGPASSLYGNNAFFSTINVVTRRGSDLKGVEIAGDGGSMNSYNGRLSYGNRYKNGLEVLLSGSIHDSDGDKSLYYPEFDQRLNPGDPSATNNGIAHNLDYERSHSFFTRLSLHDLTLEGAYVDRKKGVPTAPYGAAFDTDMFTVDKRGFVDLKYEHAYPQVGVMARIFYDHYDYHSPFPSNAAATGDPPALVINWDSAKNDWLGTELQFTKVLFDRHRVIAGGEYVYNMVQAFENHDIDPFQQYLDVNKTTSKSGLYLQDEFTILKNLTLNAGIRYDHFSTFGDTFSPRATLIYTPFKKTTVKLIYGEAFRAPNNYELYYDDTIFQKGNKNLKPEKVRTYEAVIEQMIGENLRLSVDGFYTETENHIVQERDPADDLLVFNNVEGEKSTGGEVELEGKWQNGLQGRVSYCYQDAREKKTNEWLLNSPQHVVKFNLIVPLYRDKLFAGTEVRYLSERRTKNSSTGGFAVANLTLFSQRLLPGLELSGSIYNLFDINWNEPGSADHLQELIPMDGRTFRVKMTYKF